MDGKGNAGIHFHGLESEDRMPKLIPSHNQEIPLKMKIKQFRYGSDNLAYLVHGNKKAVAIDGGAVGEILAFIQKNGLTLGYVANTHVHPDHTPGNRELLTRTHAVHLDMNTLFQNGKIEIDGEPLTVFPTPGHTTDSVTFYQDGTLITGDTLFNGTVGNCFSGDLDAFFRSIKRLMEFPPETRVYAGHDYVDYAMKFARIIEPGNGDIDTYLKKYDPCHVFSTLSDEGRVNPYLRFNDSRIVSVLEQRHLPVETEYQRWEGVMAIG